MVRGLTWQYGRHDIASGRERSMAIERTTSKAKVEVISRVWSACLPEIFYSKSRSIFSHAMALHNCKQGHEWINYNNIYKTSLLNISNISMDLSVATWIHSYKITTVTHGKFTVSEIRNITKPSLHACASHHRDHKNTWNTPL